MHDGADLVTLTDRGWTHAFDRLAARGGGVLWVPAGITTCDPARVDLANYPSLRNNVAIRGAGCGASRVDLGVGSGDGFSLVDGDGGDHFYLEITGVGFHGERDGVLFRLGQDDFDDAYNSCTLRIATNNGATDAVAACRLNHVLNTQHFGVHNAASGTALDCRQVQFGGITGSVSSRDGVSLALSGHSFANVVAWLNVEACDDGIRIADETATINRFGMLYGANVRGTLWRHDADAETRIDAAFVGEAVDRVDERTAGSYTVGLSNRPFEESEST